MSLPSGRRPRPVIIEYLAPPNQRIYGLGQVTETGEVMADEEETLGSLPGGECDVVKADGTTVSNEVYHKELARERQS